METNECALCGQISKLTFEHIPPRCAFNDKTIYVSRYEHFGDKSNPLYGKSARSQRGFGKQCLCASCNNSTGKWYASDFCAFVEQGFKILKENKSPIVVHGEYIIKPLNVIKQILMMFVAADSSGVLRSRSGVKDYLLIKDNQNFPEKLNIYLYSNASRDKRMLGYCFGADPSIGLWQWSEINFQPFGYFLTYDSPPPNEYMVNISAFTEKLYDQICNVTMTTAYLSVSSMLIGTYDNVSNL